MKIDKILSNDEYRSYVSDILSSKSFQNLGEYAHHGTDRLSHSLNVSYNMYIYCKRFRLDVYSGTRAGLLHDFEYGELDIFNHPKKALENSEKEFKLNEKEMDIIVKHMWPLCSGMPKYQETYLITVIDKLCAINEFINIFIQIFRLKNKVIFKSKHPD